MYAVGHNSPGYLPESEPWTTDDWATAAAMMVEQIEGYTEDAPLTLAEANAVSVALQDAADAHLLRTPCPLGYILSVAGVEVSFWLDLL